MMTDAPEHTAQQVMISGTIVSSMFAIIQAMSSGDGWLAMVGDDGSHEC